MRASGRECTRAGEVRGSTEGELLSLKMTYKARRLKPRHSIHIIKVWQNVLSAVSSRKRRNTNYWLNLKNPAICCSIQDLGNPYYSPYQLQVNAQENNNLLRFDLWVGKIPWSGKWHPTPVLFPGKFHGQRSLTGCSPWGRKESDATERLSADTPFAHHYIKVQ